MLFALVLPFPARTQPDLPPPLIPLPARVVWQPGTFHVDARTVILAETDTGAAMATARYVAALIGQVSSFQPDVAVHDGLRQPDNSILFSIQSRGERMHPEGYMLRVDPRRVLIRASAGAGVFHAAQTLRQLFPARFESPALQHPTRRDTVRGWDLPACMIQDAPRFAWRGLLLDCCRHFMDVEFVMRTIDLIAQLKMNRLHWHLTDDQGWRIEIQRYPALTRVGAWRTEKDGTRHGGFYTQEQIRAIVAHAAARQVTIVPEIEMPGHALAALASHPELGCTGGPYSVANDWGVFKDIFCAGKEETFTFIEHVLSEVMELFPSEYIHIGGDEAPTFHWERCVQCQARMTAEGLEDEHALQSWFIARVGRFLAEHGRRLIGWDEILEGGLPEGATVQSWRGMDGATAAVRAGQHAIVSPTSHAYFDYPVSSIDLERVYSFEPIPAGLTTIDASRILGGECNMWTEHAPQHLVDGKIFPRILAMAEVLWTPVRQREYSAFHRRVDAFYPRLDSLGIRYGFEAPAVSFDIARDSTDRRFTVRLISGQSGLRFRYIDPAAPSTPRAYDGPVHLRGRGVLRAVAEATDTARAGGTLRSDTLALSYDWHDGVDATVTLGQRFHTSYAAGGAGAVVDGLRGTDYFRDGRWQGYEDTDVEITLDLGAERMITELAAGFLQYQPAWIFMPRQVSFSVSRDGQRYTDVATIANEASDRDGHACTRDFRATTARVSARYVRLRAETIGVCPDWHPGAGGKAWIFIDEFIVR
ncbi:MAG: family 20 glycosylhydrolase [Bacteroidota bacterium]|jgi:hexosaminidase|nr:family 20 glycosylhydrolase [Bacteroidota bacterium]